jgi:hypothetical protein
MVLQGSRQSTGEEKALRKILAEPLEVLALRTGLEPASWGLTGCRVFRRISATNAAKGQLAILESGRSIAMKWTFIRLSAKVICFRANHVFQSIVASIKLATALKQG